MGDVVVVPCAEEDGGRRGAPGHHEGCKVGDADLGGDVDGEVDEKAGEGEEEAEDDERAAEADVVGGEGEDEEDDGAGDVRRDGV